MTKRFHIDKHGVPAPCRATKGNCPYGGEDGTENHFDNLEEAQSHADKINSTKFGTLPGSPKLPNSEWKGQYAKAAFEDGSVIDGEITQIHYEEYDGKHEAIGFSVEDRSGNARYIDRYEAVDLAVGGDTESELKYPNSEWKGQYAEAVFEDGSVIQGEIDKIHYEEYDGEYDTIGLTVKDENGNTQYIDRYEAENLGVGENPANKFKYNEGDLSGMKDKNIEVEYDGKSFSGKVIGSHYDSDGSERNGVIIQNEDGEVKYIKTKRLTSLSVNDDS